jgi:hypothetical protein
MKDATGHFPHIAKKEDSFANRSKKPKEAES